MDKTQFTLQQLRIFWAIAHGPSLTQAAKDLGITQPSLSQHLARLESAVGGRLFDRSGSALSLTDAGSYLLERTETLLAEADETSARLNEFMGGERGRISLGMLPSLARVLLPPAMAILAQTRPHLELDIHELPPAAAIDQLYGRNLQMTVLSGNALADNRLSFASVPLCSDPYLLAAPKGLDLQKVKNPAKDLPKGDLETLRRTIHFDFGSQHTKRMEELYRQLIPRPLIAARCRSYDTALALVEAGQGIAIIPQFTVASEHYRFFNVALYHLPLPRRRLMAITPSQYRHAQPFADLISALVQSGAGLEDHEVLTPPPFAQTQLAAGGHAAPA